MVAGRLVANRSTLLRFAAIGFALGRRILTGVMLSRCFTTTGGSLRLVPNVRRVAAAGLAPRDQLTRWMHEWN